MPQRMEFGFSFGPSDAAPSAKRGPLRLLLLGDFSARPAGQKPALAERPSHRLDLDNLDELMRRLAPSIQLPAGEIGFEKIDDFHPEQLYARLPLFQTLRQARSRPFDSDDSGSLLDQLLGKSIADKPLSSASATPTAATGLDALIRNLVAPHIVANQSASLQARYAAVDALIGEQLRGLLHAPAFQSLEAVWRGVQWLLANLELDAQLELHLFDVSREELMADIVASNGHWAQSGLHHALAERWRNLPGGQSWSALVGLYQFGASDADVGLLAALGLIASHAGGPLLAGGDPGLATLAPDQQASWQALRHSEAAPWIGLAGPRVLLRLPYGKKSDPVEGFAFEEFAATPVHEEFLWGNGALAVALAVGRSFKARGWDFAPGDAREIADLPAFSYVIDGEPELQACAEHFLGEEAGLALLAAGLMPLMSHRNRGALTLLRCQSVAMPSAALAGLSLLG